MNVLTVNKSKCTKCGICVASCPISLIETNKADKTPELTAEKEKMCIYCGHCESICPDEALTHQLSEKALNPLESGFAKINPSELGKYFRNRRSIRNYKSKLVDRKILEEIMDVVRYAPTGTNQQRNQWIIVSGSEMVQKLAEGVIDWMRVVSQANPEMAGMYNLKMLVDTFDNGYDIICRNAPHIIIGYSPANYPIGANDVVIATSHLELLAPSYGLGTCWAGFLMMAIRNSTEVKKVVGLDASSAVYTATMLGYPKYQYYRTPVRNKADVKWL